MQRFAIVEFEDGLQLMPSTWMSDNEKECFWPPYSSLSKVNRAISDCEVVFDNWQTLKIIHIFGTANSYENGIEKVKLAEQFSDIDSIDNEKSKRSRRNHAKKIYDSDDEIDSNDEIMSSLPPPPKMPSTLANKFSKSQPSKGRNYACTSSKILKDNSNSADTKESSPKIILLTSSKILKENYNPTDVMKESSPLTNNSELFTKIQLLMSTYAADIELKKELLRRTNQIFAKLESADDRLHNIEEKINGIGQGVNDNIYDITEIVLLPLQTQDDIKALKHDLKDKDFF